MCFQLHSNIRTLKDDDMMKTSEDSIFRKDAIRFKEKMQFVSEAFAR